MLETFINTLLSAQADSVCGAEYGVRSPDRSNRRNGYRHRDLLDTRVGTVDVAVPKLREGSFFPDWLLQRRRRAEAALTTVVATCYLLGVSTRRMDKLVQSLGITGLSKSQVSEMAKDLDEHVEQFRTRPLGDGPYTFVAADALTMKVREGGRVVKVAVMVATGVNADGYREILGMHVATTESGAGLAGLLPRPGRPRPDQPRPGSPGDVGRAHRPGRRGRCDPARRGVAAVPHPLRGEPDGRHPEELVGVGQGVAALGVRPARRGGGERPVRPGPRRPASASCPPSPTTSRPPAPTCSRSPSSPGRYGVRSGRTTRTSGSTGRSAGAPTSSASSRTGTPSSAWSAPSWPSSTTNGPSNAATSASTSWLDHEPS